MKADLKSSKNRILDTVVKKNQEDGNTRIVKNISLDEIEENPVNENIFGIKDVELLAEIIDTEGFSGAINVIKLKNGHYQIYSGHRRYRAVKLLGWDTIPCTVEEGLSQTLLKRKLLNSNIQTRKMSPLNYARAVAEYEDILKNEKFKGNTREELARIFNTSGSVIYRYQAINKMIPELQELTDSEDFPYAAFESATGLNKEQQKKLLSMIQDYQEQYANTGLSRAIVLQFINSIKEENERTKEDRRRQGMQRKIESDEITDKKSVSDEEFGNVLFENYEDEKNAKYTPVIPDDPFREEHYESKVYNIDQEIMRVLEIMKYNSKESFSVGNKKAVKTALKEIEKYIEVIKSKIG